ncbi:TlpA disulfide reductase family protein [Reichenbachiella sp. MSK19-1]|uniref:TlpA family protein disulfide reductase n=1 Tax=Reichenbachiella sp. MSK19-1 TaxID=1897631 RepID=UPI000E6C8694|nr:TlpA disulfide reductase family protein [Reichenbachiella sp. MSK19-1]RJE75000.1 hypothetical protein BGP76_17955 [Reichenbachiella sp. MSK19-1]
MKKHYTQKALMCLILVTSLLTLSQHSKAQSTLRIELKEINGEYYTLDDLKGSELTVVDFWATWCKPCVKSIPKLVELSHQYEKEEVAFVGINVDSPRNLAKVRPFSKSLKIDYPVLLDTDQALYNELLVSVLPTVLILDSEGKVLFTHEGYTHGDEEYLKEKINELLEENE